MREGTAYQVDRVQFKIPQDRRLGKRIGPVSASTTPLTLTLTLTLTLNYDAVHLVRGPLTHYSRIVLKP